MDDVKRLPKVGEYWINKYGGKAKILFVDDNGVYFLFTYSSAKERVYALDLETFLDSYSPPLREIWVNEYRNFSAVHNTLQDAIDGKFPNDPSCVRTVKFIEAPDQE